MSNILNVIAPNIGNTFPQFPTSAGSHNPATAFLEAFVSQTGGLDTQLLGVALGKLSLSDPSLAAAIKSELSFGLAKLGPVAQGNFERTFQAEANATKTKPTSSNTVSGDAELIPFAKEGEVSVSWDKWITDAKAASAGSPNKIRYNEMVRFAGTDNPAALKMIMQENFESRSTIGEVRGNKTPGASVPLSGFELRYRMGADRDQVLANAKTEIQILTAGITAIETNGAATTPDKAEALQLRQMLQPAINRYALASDNPNALRTMPALSDARFQTNVEVGVAYRKAGDEIAANKGSAALPEAGNVAEAATRIRSVAGAEKYDAYMDRSISAASVKYIPIGATGAEARTNIIRQLGVGREQSAIAIDSPATNALSPFAFNSAEERSKAMYDRTTMQVGNNVIEQAMLQGVTEAEKKDLKWGAHAAVGREFYMDYTGMMTGGMAAILTRAAKGPIRITAENLDAKGLFMGTHNAGAQTPRFDKWVKDGGFVELMPGGQIRYTKMIDDKTVLSVTNGRSVTVNYKEGLPDFTPFMKHTSGVKSVQIDVTGIDRKDFKAANIAAGHPEWGDVPPKGWTWHHHEDAKTMQLVPREINGQFFHKGGASVVKNRP